MHVDEQQIDKYLPGVRKKLEWLSEEDLLKRVLSLEFNRLLKYYQDMPDIDLNAKDGKQGRERGEGRQRERGDKNRRTAEKGYERIMVNIGKSEGFFPGNLMETINRNITGKKPDIGRIDLLPGYTLFDVRSDDAQRVVRALKNADFFGRRLYAEIAQPDKDYGDAGDAAGKGFKKKKDKKDKKEKKGKKGAAAAAKKPKYNGNYDIFMKKKK